MLPDRNSVERFVENDTVKSDRVVKEYSKNIRLNPEGRPVDRPSRSTDSIEAAWSEFRPYCVLTFERMSSALALASLSRDIRYLWLWNPPLSSDSA